MSADARTKIWKRSCQRFLQNIDLSSVKVINGRALYGLDRSDLVLKNLEITKGNIIEGISNLKTITVGDKLEILQDETFTNCDTLEEVTLGKKVKDIWFDSLSNNKNLFSVIGDPVPFRTKRCICYTDGELIVCHL